jgi:hypothetical protein
MQADEPGTAFHRVEHEIPEPGAGRVHVTIEKQFVRSHLEQKGRKASEIRTESWAEESLVGILPCEIHRCGNA